MTEDQLKAAVIQMAETLRWMLYSIRRSDLAKVQGRTGAGFPDLVLVRHSRLMFVELKSEKGRIRPEQHGWLNALRQVYEVEVHIWRPSDWTNGEIEAALR